jgi:hypothetical protein
MPNTYVALRTETVATATPSVTFSLSGISGYTDLVLVANGSTSTATGNVRVQFNGDTAANYSNTRVLGDGSAASSARDSNVGSSAIGDWGTDRCTLVTNFQNYSNSTTNKTILSRSGSEGYVSAYVGLWRNTGAITSITIFKNSSNFTVGSTFSLYGIANADQGAAKATGGIITEDSQYWYHTFGASGAFIPKQSLTCDVLVVAGGAGGGRKIGGGGGAGGVLAFTNQSLTAISHNVTVGAGGAGGAVSEAFGTNGVDSQFASLTLVKGGGGGGYYLDDGLGSGTDGRTGGSGGGGSAADTVSRAGGSGTTSQGNTGGAGLAGTSPYAAGGGGGAGAVGAAGSAGGGGNGGAGLNSLSGLNLGTFASVTNTGSSGYYGGGGGGTRLGSGINGSGGIGGGGAASANGVATSGGGGGGAGYVGGSAAGNGGSGIVIVRYAK